MLAIAEADGERAKAHLDRLLASSLPPSAKLESHIRGLIDAYFERPYLHRLLQKLLREGSPAVSAKIGAALVGPTARARRIIIEDGIAKGEFRNVDPAHISFAIDGACSHIFSSEEGRRAVTGSGDLPRALVESYARTVSELVVRGLLAV